MVYFTGLYEGGKKTQTRQRDNIDKEEVVVGRSIQQNDNKEGD